MALQRPSFSPLSFLFFQLLAALHTTSDAALSSHQPQVMDCSTSGNYTSTGAFAANLNQFLAALPDNAVSNNGGFFNGTVGKGADTVYGLAMCSADYSRSDCGDCLAATASSNANGLPNLCPGSTTVLAWFDPCLVRYSNTNFFGRAEIGPIYKFQSASVSGDLTYSDAVVKSLKEATANAVTSPHRFAATLTDPYTFVQCTWDLPPDQCKQCLDVISTNATEYDWWTMKTEGKRKSHSCALRYSNTSFVVAPFRGAPMPQSKDQAAGSDTQSSGTGKGSLTVGLVGSLVGLILLACLAALIWKVLKLRSQCRRGHVREFTYRELASATREFAGTRKLGQGAFGVVYKGAVMMQDREVDVAIKKNINDVTAESRAAFKNEVDIMKPLNHLNIIRLVGWCENRNSLLLVYELVEDRNLEDRLYGGGASVSSGSGLFLDWRQRYNILVGIASGLDYLHNKCVKTVLHRDIKPGNVMLDRDFNAKLCDFGLVTQLTHAVTSRSTNNVIGTQGYMDPSFEENGKIIRESDVYSFGVLLLEVVCGVKPKLIVIDRDTKNSLVDMVREYKKKNAILDAADQHLRGKFDDQIKGALLIGLNCVETSRGDRPTIQIVLSKLSGLRDSYVVV